MIFEVNSFNLKSRSTIFKLTIAFVFTIFGLVLLLSIGNQKHDMIVPVIILGTILTLVFPLLLTIIKTSKVIFDKDKVTRVSILGTTTILFDDIKSYGTFVQSRYSSRLVDNDELDENELAATNMIFLSESTTFNLNKLRLPKHIRLEYRADVYHKIKEWVKTASAQSSRRPRQL